MRTPCLLLYIMFPLQIGDETFLFFYLILRDSRYIANLAKIYIENTLLYYKDIDRSLNYKQNGIFTLTYGIE